ncbi:MAG: hypothetical protein H6581_11385 [Bacteroidia bacterium]|nr:hypothetical protein [Bacteroidia bacterium]
MKFTHLTASFILGFLLVLSACKERDTSDPEVTLLSPNGPVFGHVGDTLTVQAAYTDDQGLASTQITIFNFASESVITSKSEVLSGLTDQINTQLVLGPKWGPGGTYILRISVQDAAGNSNFLEFTLSLFEVPQKFSGLFWTGINQFDESSLFASDTLNQITNYGKIGNGISDLEVDPDYGYIYHCDEFSGHFMGRDLADPTQIKFDNLVSNNPPESAFTDLCIIGQEVVASLGIKPYGRVYSNDGQSLRTFNDLQNPALAIAPSTLDGKQEIFLTQQDIAGSVKRVDRYNYALNIHTNSSPLTWAPSDLVPSFDGGFVVGGNSGTGEIMVFAPDLSPLYAHTLSGDFLQIEISASKEKYFILTSNGLFSLNANGDLPPVLVISGSYTCFFHDEVRDEFYLGALNGIDRVSGGGNFIESITGTFGTVGFIRGNYFR